MKILKIFIIVFLVIGFFELKSEEKKNNVLADEDVQFIQSSLQATTTSTHVDDEVSPHVEHLKSRHRKSAEHYQTLQATRILDNHTPTFPHLKAKVLTIASSTHPLESLHEFNTSTQTASARTIPASTPI